MDGWMAARSGAQKPAVHFTFANWKLTLFLILSHFTHCVCSFLHFLLYT